MAEKDKDTRTKKTFKALLSSEETDKFREVFVTRYIARFHQKHQKYCKLLQENGATIPQGLSTCSMNFCSSFEDEVEMILSEKRNKIKHACKVKGFYSVKSLFRQVYKIVRRARASRIECKLLDIPNYDLLDTLKDIASELSYAFEYQIAMMTSEADVRALADHAVSCSMNYLKDSEAVFNRCSILEAITDVHPTKSLRRAEKVTTRIQKTDAIKGTRAQKWRLSEIFKQPGLRIPNEGGTGYIFYGCFTPYGSVCRPDKYGFRGTMHVWDEKQSDYVLLYNDQISCTSSRRREIETDDTCIHQMYQPSSLCLHNPKVKCIPLPRNKTCQHSETEENFEQETKDVEENADGTSKNGTYVSTEDKTVVDENEIVLNENVDTEKVI